MKRNKREIKILITGAGIFGNKGSRAMILGLQKSLKEEFKNFDLKYFLLSARYEYEKKIYKNYNFKEIFPRGNLRLNLKDYILYKFFRFEKVFPKNQFFKAVSSCDLVIDCSGISFHDSLGKFSDNLYQTLNWWLIIKTPKLFNKKVIKFTQTFGPQKYFLTKFIAKNALNDADLIIPRGKESQRYLKNILKIDRKLDFFPDIAFTLDYKKKNSVKELLPENFSFQSYQKIIGICPNSMIELTEDKKGNYFQFWVDFINNLNARHQKFAIFIIVYRDKTENNLDGDFLLASNIILKLEKTQNVFFFNSNLSLEETGAIINCCDIFLGSRYHSLVAALSQGVPSIAIGWNYKYQELFDLFGKGKFVIFFDKMSYKKLFFSFEDMLRRHLQIRKEILRDLEKIKQRSRHAVKLAREAYSVD